MSDRRRPWLAAVLALVISGLGHAYLRRWARAFGWYAAVTATLVLIVPDTAIDQLFAGTLPPVDDIGPAVVVIAASVIDAYVVAVRHNRRVESTTSTAVTAPEETTATDRGGPSRAIDDGHKRDSATEQFDPTATATTETKGDHSEEVVVACPDCGRQTDDELDFCQWCATPLEAEADER